MSDTFQPNRKTTRLQNWNYSWKRLYFVTINTKFGEPYFGEIVDDRVQLNEIGQEVEKQWLLTPSFRPDMNLVLDEFIVMPNHFHGIIGIGANKFNSCSSSGQQPFDNSALNCQICRDLILSNDYTSAIQAQGPHAVPTIQKGGVFGPQIKNLGSIIRGFKSSISSLCKNNHVLFDWQSRYHDIIIHDEKTLNKIRNYIRNNPKNWNKDRFYKS